MWNRFWKKVNKTETCWLWDGCIIKGGYGQFGNGKKVVYVHRLVYELFKGKIPKGKVLDHLCKNRNCVNPNHLEAVTQKENVMRGVGIASVNSKRIKCIHGHDNFKYLPKFHMRRCITCSMLRQRKAVAKKKGLNI